MRKKQTEEKIGSFLISELLYENKAARYLSYWLVGLFLLVIVCMFLPWQQNVRAYGEVTAFSPKDRPQKVYATVPGQIQEWNIQEGQLVEKGDTLVVVSEIKSEYFDPNIIARKRSQIEASEESIGQLFDKIRSIDRQIDAMEEGLSISLRKARNKIKDAKYKVQADSADVQAAQLNYLTADTQYIREKSLYKEGIKSLTDLENKKMKMQETQAKLQAAQNKLQISQNSYLNSIMQLTSIEAEYNDKISKAISEKNSTLSYINEAESKLTKMQIDLTNLEMRRAYYIITAPQKGYIVKSNRSGIGEILKEGDPLLTIMPYEPEMATEIYVSATDLPLLSKGDEVRIRFDGWPALVFSGWPNASLGTFGGKIQVIDYVNSYGNYYRVLVTPDPKAEQWPEQIRIGSGVYAWAMLEDVPIWYEIWRQLNGFPPDISPEKLSQQQKRPGKKEEKEEK